MSLQLSTLVRNNRLDAIEVQIGTAPRLEIRSGPPPASCAAADTGTLLAYGSLPSDWMSAAAAGSKAKLGTWTITGVAAGVAGHFRLKDSGSPDTCHIQGTAGLTGSPDYDMALDNDNIAPSQVVTVNTFTLTDANA